MTKSISEEAARYFIGYGSFIKEKSHVAQELLENILESRGSHAIFLETHEMTGNELSDILKNHQAVLLINFDCNMVMEKKDSLVVTGDLTSLEFEDAKKIIYAKTDDSIFCFKME